MKKILTVLLLSAMFTVPSAVQATAEENSEKSPPELSPVKVSANRVEETNKTEETDNRFFLPASSQTATETFTRKEIESMHPKDVFEIIEQGMGIMTSYRGRKDFNNVQGRAGDAIGIIVDGIYIPWSQSSRILANLPVEWIESVKLIRDSTVLTVGPLAAFTSNLGSPNQGFIIISTKKPSTTATEAKISYSSFDTEKFSIFHGEKLDNHYYGIGYARSSTNGKDDWYNGSDAGSFLLKSGYEGKDVTYSTSLYMDRGSRQFQRGAVDSTLSDAKWKYDPLKTMMFSFNLAKPWDDRNITQFSFGFSKVEDDFIQEYFSKKSRTVYNQKDYLREFNLSHTITSGNNTLKLGGQALLWHSPTGAFYYETIERKEELYGFYIYDENHVNDKLTLDGGMRVDRKHISKGINRYLVTGNKGTDQFEDQWAEKATSYALGASYKLDPVYCLSTRISYSKQPTDSYLTTLNNEVLDPEVRLKYEAGITAKYSNAFNASLTAFFYDIDDYKVSVGTKKSGSDTVNVYDNTDIIRKGLELGFYGRLSPVWSYNLGYSYITSSNVTDNGEIPHNLYTLRLNHHVKDWDSNLIARSVGSFSKYGKCLGDYTSIDVNVTKKLNAITSLTLFGRNITDEHYATQYVVSEKGTGSPEGFYYDPGAVYGIELSTKF